MTSLTHPIENRHWRPTMTYFLLFVGIGMMGGILGPALPFLAEQTGSTMSQIAILFTARALGNIVGSVVSGHLLDRTQGHRVLLGMLALALAGLILMPISPLLWLMALLVLLMGFSEVSLNTGSNVLMLWWHGERSGPYISALHFCYGVGAMVVPLVIMLAISQGMSVVWAFWLVGAYMLLVGVVLSPQRSPDNPARQDNSAPDRPYDKAVFFGMVVLFGLYVGIEITFAGWITTYGMLNGLASGRAAFLVSVFWLSLSGGRLLAIPLLRLGYHTALLYSCYSLATAMMLALYFGWLPLTLITLLFGLALSAIFPTLFTLGNQMMTLNGKRTGLIFFGIGIGALIAPSVMGPLIELVGTQAFPLVLAGMLTVKMLGLSAVLCRQRHLRMRGPFSA